MKFLEFVNMGGKINWALFLIMCFSCCQCIERCIYFSFSSKKCEKRSFMARIQKKCAQLSSLPQKQKLKELEKESSLIFYDMNRGLWFLNFIAVVAPSIGLLGTVVGLISAFQQISDVGASVSMQDLSGGIWVAMITTEFGMMISIPVLFFYRTFKRISEKRMMALALFIQEQEEEGEK